MKKSQSGNISHIWGEAATVPIETIICMVGNLRDVITCANFRNEIFSVLILQGVEFHIFLMIFAWCLQQCSATVILHIAVDVYTATGTSDTCDICGTEIAPTHLMQFLQEKKVCTNYSLEKYNVQNAASQTVHLRTKHTKHRHFVVQRNQQLSFVFSVAQTPRLLVVELMFIDDDATQ